MDNHLKALNIEEWWVMMEPTEDLKEISLDNSFPGWIIFIGAQADPLDRKELTFFLKDNQDIFAWSHEDMTQSIQTSWFTSLMYPYTSLPSDRRRVFLPNRETRP